MDRTIKVTGKGKISVAPDMIRLTITQSRTAHTYEGAVKESAAKKNALTKALEKLGFKFVSSEEDKKSIKIEGIIIP